MGAATSLYAIQAIPLVAAVQGLPRQAHAVPVIQPPLDAERVTARLLLAPLARPRAPSAALGTDNTYEAEPVDRSKSPHARSKGCCHRKPGNMHRIILGTHSLSNSFAKSSTAKTSDNSSYVLKLDNRLVWHLTATDEAAAWLKTLAAILELEAAGSAWAETVRFTRRAAGSTWYGGSDGPSGRDKASFLSVHGCRPRDLGVLCLWSRPDREDIVGELLDLDPVPRHLDILMMSQCLHFVHDKALNFGGVPFHAALVELSGKGVLLAGRGGIGKSTCCRRLPAHWKVWCDDESLVLPDESGRYVAHPFPTWKDQPVPSSQTWPVGDRVPLSAIFFLDRGEADGVLPLGRGEAATRINLSAMQICFLHLEYLANDEQRAWRKRIFDNACCLADSIPAFVLRVSPTGPFWQEMERALETLSDP